MSNNKQLELKKGDVVWYKGKRVYITEVKYKVNTIISKLVITNHIKIKNKTVDIDEIETLHQRRVRTLKEIDKETDSEND